MYTIISIIVLMISWYLFSKVAGSMKLTQLNMVSWIFYVQLIAMSFIASILVINGWADDHHAISNVSDDAKFYGWLSVQYTMIAMPLGMLFINFLHGYKTNKRLFLSYIHAPVTTLISRKDSFVKYPLYILSLISLLSIAYVVILSRNIPIFESFHGMDAQALAGLRIEAGREFAGINFIKQFFGSALTSVLSYVAYAYWRVTKSREYFIWFLIMFVLSLFILTYELAKSPLAIYILGFLFLSVLIKGGVKKITLSCFIGAIIISLVLAYVFIAKIDDTGHLLNAIMERILLEQAAGTYLSFEYFPRMHEFIGLSSLTRIFSLVFGMDVSENAARIIMTMHNPLGVETGVSGVMNSLFIQEAWANFGLAGVVIAPFYVGMFVQIIYMFFLKSKKTPIILGIFTYFSNTMPITVSFNEFLLNRSLLFFTVVFISVYVGALILKFLKRNAHKDYTALSNPA